MDEESCEVFMFVTHWCRGVTAFHFGVILTVFHGWCLFLFLWQHDRCVYGETGVVSGEGVIVDTDCWG